MIVKTFYIKCDNCGEEDVFTAGKTHAAVKTKALDRGWQKVGNFDFCPTCKIATTAKREPLKVEKD